MAKAELDFSQALTNNVKVSVLRQTQSARLKCYFVSSAHSMRCALVAEC